MTIDAMTTRNLYQQGQAPEVKASPATTEDLHMGRLKIGPKIPQAVLAKTGLSVGDKVPSDWDEDQVERWQRRGYLVVDGGRARETAQAGAQRETRGGGSEVPGPHPEPEQCTATTKSGNRCKRTAVAGADVCATHQ